MEAFIQGLISLALGPIRGVIDGISNRLSAIYHNFVDAFGRARNGFVYWVGKGRSWATATIHHALVVATVIRWVVLVYAPQLVAARIAQAVAWAGQELTQLRGWAGALVDQAVRWAQARLGDIIADLGRLRDWAFAQLAQLRSDVRTVVDRVFGPLGSPERLAAWILAPLLGLLVQWLVDHAVELAAIAWQRRETITDRAIDVSEDLIERIF